MTEVPEQVAVGEPNVDGGIPNGFVVVVLAADVDLDPKRDLVSVLDGNDAFGPLVGVLIRLKGPATTRLLDPEGIKNALLIDELVGQVEPDPTRISRTRFWRIDLRDKRADPEAVAAEIAGLPGVETAYAEAQLADAPTEAAVAAAPVMLAQGYLDPRPCGIDAVSAWARPGGGGEKVRLVDVEQAWRLTHPAISSQGPSVLPDAVRHNHDGINGFVGDHGTSSLAVVAASGPAARIRGVAPRLAAVNASSHYDAVANTDMHVSAAIDQATLALGPGDVILLEVQRLAPGGKLPTEMDLADFSSIKDAVRLKRIVVEAAGNGSRDLDAWRHPVATRRTGVRRLDRTDPASDSGAIMVGACVSKVVTGGHFRLPESNFGSRVDCFAWGEKVATATAVDYTTDFNGTSSASAIVAGAVVVAQGMNLAIRPAPVEPQRMRELMADPAGTPETRLNMATPPTIGFMPDLTVVAARLAAEVGPAVG